MKKISLLILYLLVLNCLGQTWSWDANLTSGSRVNLVSDVFNDVYAVPSNGTYFKKYNSSGALLWQKLFTGDIHIRRLITVADGTVYLIGYNTANAIFDGVALTCAGYSDSFIACYSRTGTLVWLETITSAADADVMDLCADQAGKLFFTGYAYDSLNFGGTAVTKEFGRDLFVARFDTNGNFETVFFSEFISTTSSFGGITGLEIETDQNNDIILFASISGKVLVDTMMFDHEMPAGYFFKMDQNFHVKWVSFVESGPSWEVSKLKLNADGKLFFLLNDYWHYNDRGSLRSLTNDGLTSWQYWWEPKGHVFGYDMDSTGNIYVAGYSGPHLGKFTVVYGKADSTGVSLWEYTDTASSFRMGNDIALLEDKYFVSGWFEDSITLATTHTTTSSDTYFLAIYEPNLISSVNEHGDKISGLLYPNPANGPINIRSDMKAGEVCIFDCYGKCVLSTRITGGSSGAVDLSGYCPGVYFVELREGRKIFKSKLILQ
jgi:hypothetical protein